MDQVVRRYERLSSPQFGLPVLATFMVTWLPGRRRRRGRALREEHKDAARERDVVDVDLGHRSVKIREQDRLRDVGRRRRDIKLELVTALKNILGQLAIEPDSSFRVTSPDSA